MDNLTHSLTAWMMGRAGLDRVCPRATALLVVSANAPDFDALSWLSGTMNYVGVHRGWTHSVVLLPVVACAPMLLVRLFSRGPFPWLRSWLLCLAGVASHILLDWTNAYGVRLFEPLSHRWYQADLTYLYDFWIWIALFLGILAPWIGKLVSAEIGARPSRGRGWAVAVLLFFFAIDGMRAFLHQRAIEILESRIYEQGPALRYAAWPSPASPFRWRGYVETPTAHRIFDVNVLGDFDPTAGRVFYKPDPSAALDAARRTAMVGDFLHFAQFPAWSVLPATEADAAFSVDVCDLRFGTPPPARFTVHTVLDDHLRVVRESFRF